MLLISNQQILKMLEIHTKMRENGKTPKTKHNFRLRRAKSAENISNTTYYIIEKIAAKGDCFAYLCEK